jgi:hypothetical protein
VKDAYVGDVNDYFKYALLRAVAAEDADELCLVWMRTTSASGTDGRRLGYLRHPDRYEAIDPQLFARIRALVLQGERTLAEVEAARLVPARRYVRTELRDGEQDRHRYLASVWREGLGASTLFFDPDNGFAPRGSRIGARSSSRYLFPHEHDAAFLRGFSVIVYQHYPRIARMPFLAGLGEAITTRTDAERVYSVSTPHVAFMITPQPGRHEALELRMKALVRRADGLMHLKAWPG